MRLPSCLLTGDHLVTYNAVVTDDLLFKALADPSRRTLLDALFQRDGRTLKELESTLELTRFGVMKHLRVLEAARLVVTRKSGREKLHFLNPIPIRLMHDRWIDKYIVPVATALIDLKTNLEKTMQKVYEIYIKTTPKKLWEAITDPELRKKYQFGVLVTSTWKAGAPYQGTAGAGMTIFEGEILESDPPRRLVQSFRAQWSDEVKQAGTSRLTWEIEQVRDSCRLTVVHDQLPDQANPQLYGGWPMILSGLKTLLETGELLTTPGSLRYASP